MLQILVVIASVISVDVRHAHELPDVQPELIEPAIDAAIEAATPEISAPLLLALAWGESRFQSEARPKCGVLQVDPKDIDAPASLCKVWASSMEAGFAAGVVELEMLLGDRRVHHDLRLALQYRACGNKAFDGTCNAKKLAWVEAALARARWLSQVVPGS